METSAENGNNINDLFIEISKVLYKNYFKYENVKNIFNNIIQNGINKNNAIRMSDSNEPILMPEESRGCCK